MLSSLSYRKTFIKLVCLLQAFLFIYAATAKCLDHENFISQLGQSPLLAPFSAYIAILIPVFELLLALSLLTTRYRLHALVASLILMISFTAYIYITLYYSSFVPCSCGGILEDMTWQQHLLFNLVFVLFDIIALLLVFRIRLFSVVRQLIVLASCFMIGICTIWILYQYAEHIIHYQNDFTRRFPQHVAQKKFSIELDYNSYYIAGASNGKIYLGNYTAPLKVLEVDTLTKKIEQRQIVLDEKELPFRTPLVKVIDDTFFLYEGVVPYLFTGPTVSWRATLKLHSGNYFSLLAPLSKTSAVVRYSNPTNGGHELGVISFKDTLQSFINGDFLRVQKEVVFDTDGSLLVNQQLHQIIYMYHYRNQFIISDFNLDVYRKGKTIDTITTAQLHVAVNPDSQMRTFAKKPLIVNKMTSTYGSLLFVNSLLPGQFESDDLWKTTSIIDVYDLNDTSYRSSFPIYNEKGKKLRDMIVYGTTLYGLIDTQLVFYHLQKHLKQDISAQELSK